MELTLERVKAAKRKIDFDRDILPEIITAIQERVEVLPWCNGSWRFLQDGHEELAIAKRQWGDELGFYIPRIGIRDLGTRFLLGHSSLTLFVAGDSQITPKIHEFLHGRPPIGQLRDSSLAVVHEIRLRSTGTLGNFEQLVIEPIVHFLDEYGKLGDGLTKALGWSSLPQTGLSLYPF